VRFRRIGPPSKFNEARYRHREGYFIFKYNVVCAPLEAKLKP